MLRKHEDVHESANVEGTLQDMVLYESEIGGGGASKERVHKCESLAGALLRGASFRDALPGTTLFLRVMRIQPRRKHSW
jgi:hypothetical protein